MKAPRIKTLSGDSTGMDFLKSGRKRVVPTVRVNHSKVSEFIKTW